MHHVLQRLREVIRVGKIKILRQVHKLEETDVALLRGLALRRVQSAIRLRHETSDQGAIVGLRCCGSDRYQLGGLDAIDRRAADASHFSPLRDQHALVAVQEAHKP